jgi:anti-sigma-K factor RskA
VAHLDPERLALLALRESVDDAGHLRECVACRAEVAALRTVADIAAETQQVRDLPAPPESVWARIEARTSAAQEAARASGASAIESVARLAVTAVLAAVAGVAGTLGVLALGGDGSSPPPPAPSVLARADLTPLPIAPPGAAGEARILGTGPGASLHLHVTGLPPRPGYYEVWLIDPQSMEMVSMGQLPDSGDGLLPVSSTVDLRKYRLVDVSAEEFDNNSAHSGRSLLRGQLTT